VQEVNWLRESNTRAAITRLSDVQLHEAEAVFRRLEGLARSLTFYVDFALANYREPEKQKPLADAVIDYVAAKEYEFKQDQISMPQMQRIRWEMKRLEPGCVQSASRGRLKAEQSLAELETHLTAALGERDDASHAKACE